MRFRFIRDHRERFQVGRMCRVLEVSRSGFYAWLKRPKSRRRLEDEKLATRIVSIHEKSRKRYGSPRIREQLQEEGFRCGRARISRLMRAHGLRPRARRKFKATTDSKHSYPVAPNLLDQNFEVNELNKVWVADITYIWTDEGWLYLATVMDLCSRSIVGWSISKSMKTELTLDALSMALGRRRIPSGLIHHSDRGSQYAARRYQRELNAHGIVPSMSRKGNCYDNAAMESFFHTLKVELVHHTRFRTRAEARAAIFEYIEVFYNRDRLHSAIGYRAPALFEAELEAVA